MKHQKHAKLSRPELGNFARHELAFLGAPCGVIQELSNALTKHLNKQFRVAYVDADHAHTDLAEEVKQEAIIDHNQLVYTDKINYHRFDLKAKIDTFSFRHWFNEQDLVLVNGNHFKAHAQLVLIDPRKFESLERKLDRLTQVKGFIKMDPALEIPAFLRAKVPDWQVLPQWHIKEIEAIASSITNDLQASRPAVNALILAGGKSQRMGTDKGALTYHGRPQREYLYDLAQTVGLTPFLSCRADQVPALPTGYEPLPDNFLGLGPFGAILSAFRQDPNKAWLVVACDLPFVNAETFNYLLKHRDPSKLATAFYNPETDFPDPLLTLWEPRAYPILLQFLSQGYSCPRKVLINSNINMVEAPDAQVLTNVNNPAEFAQVKEQLGLIK